MHNPDREGLVQLTKSLYRLTLLFPKKEPLRYKMREEAIEILANPGKENFEILDNFFEVAKAQNWVSRDELSKAKEDYLKLARQSLEEKAVKDAKGAEDLIKEAKEKIEMPLLPSQPESAVAENRSDKDFRQQKILTFLRNNGRAQVGELKKTLPDISKRTLRRDFRTLLKQGIIERVGERGDTFYKILVRTG